MMKVDECVRLGKFNFKHKSSRKVHVLVGGWLVGVQVLKADPHSKEPGSNVVEGDSADDAKLMQSTVGEEQYALMSEEWCDPGSTNRCLVKCHTAA
ncbi:hypothetical protein CEXT_492311 [Caerostris extrusa]|uniref:Uncharacterized protein n=1 Tax=Caerostris extrusa TaxID=172846 RepID=A0AAV4WUW5_CAEEX|nr:hypothetical protein CEXT_492311 [Caerostris extrusa]